MAHQRKLIRQAVVALLVAANTAAGARVASTRVDPHKAASLPAISVYTLSETTDVEASEQTAPVELKRELQLEITAWVAHTDQVHADDAMDNLAEQIEAAMDADPTLDDTAEQALLVGTTMQVVEDDARSDPLVGIITLTYAVTYRTSPAADGEFDDFLRVDAVHQPGGGIEGDTEPAEDLFAVQLGGDEYEET